MATRLEDLLARQAKLEAQISGERVKAEADKALGGILAELAEGHTLAPLEGKVLRVVEGKLVLNGHSNGNGKPKAEKATNGEKATKATNGNGGNGGPYFLADGRGPFATIQEVLDGMGVDKAKRPRHNRWDRLSAELQGKILREKPQAEPEAA